MRNILLLSSAYNGLTQRVQCELVRKGYKAQAIIATNSSQMEKAVASIKPDLILAPMLKSVIPESIWKSTKSLILHPGIKGDRGPSSLDWAILDKRDRWGVTVVEADYEMDAGAIWENRDFAFESKRKSSLYNQEVSDYAVEALLSATENFFNGGFTPEPLNYSNPDVLGCLMPSMKKKQRSIDWFNHNTKQVITQIYCADGAPGATATIQGESFHLFGVHQAHENYSQIKGEPGQILIYTDTAILVKTIDGAVFITHAKKAKKDGQSFIKLPAVSVMEPQLKHVPYVPNAFKQITYSEKEDVGYLNFDLYNGAMGTQDCLRLQEAFKFASSSQNTKALVLVGNRDFWSNGINLNTIEGSANPAAEAWNNIQAIDDLV